MLKTECGVGCEIRTARAKNGHGLIAGTVLARVQGMQSVLKRMQEL